jgi:hypothetical protein
MWLRVFALGRTPRSCASTSCSRITVHAVSRASAACASVIRALTNSDLTAPTEVPSELATSAYDMPANSRISSAERC